MTRGTAGKQTVSSKEQAEPGPLCLGQLLAAQELDSHVVTFGDTGGEEQSLVRGNPPAWGCWGEGVTPQGKKQGGIRHLGWRNLRTKEVAAKGGKMAGKCQGSRQRWQRVRSWQRRSLLQNDWDHLVYVNTFYFTVWEECK